MSQTWSEAKYLVAAPCGEFDSDWRSAFVLSGAASHAGPLLTSRDEFKADLLAAMGQVRLPDRVVEYAIGGSREMSGRFAHARIETIAGIRIFSAELEVGGTNDLVVADLEAVITGLVGVYLTEAPECQGQLMWVNRTLITKDPSAPMDWLARSAKTAFGSIEDGGDELPALSLGWGNNALVGFAGDSQDLEGIRYGILLGQALWAQLNAVDSISGELINDLAGARVSLRRGDGIKRDLTASSLLALHGLCRDELASTIQGTPAIVAGGMLEAWNYPAYRSRLGDRSAEISRILDLRAQLRSRGYQHTVEIVLFGIGLLTILSTVLDVVQTGFSGGISKYPGHEGSSAVMNLARTVDLDVALGLTVGTMLVLLVVVLYLRRNSDG